MGLGNVTSAKQNEECSVPRGLWVQLESSVTFGRKATLTSQISPRKGRNCSEAAKAKLQTIPIEPIMSRPLLIVSWTCRLVAAIILLQTLFFKFTAAPESVYIFTKLGTFINAHIPSASINTVEVSGRIGSGIMELIAAVLLLTPRFVWAGAILAMAATGGAIASHLTFLGIEVQGDKGLLFFLAIAVFVTSAIALFLHRMQIPVLGNRP